MEITAFPLAEAQRGLSFPNSSPGPSEVWDSFYPGSETAQEFTGSCFFSFTELQPLPFMQRRAEPGKHTEREGKSLFPPLPELLFPLLPSQTGLCTAPEAPTLGFFPHGFQSVKNHILALFCGRGSFQSRIPIGMPGPGLLLQDPVGTQCSPGRIWGAGNGKILKFSEPRGLGPSPAAWLSSHSALPRLLIHL